MFVTDLAIRIDTRKRLADLLRENDAHVSLLLPHKLQFHDWAGIWLPSPRACNPYLNYFKIASYFLVIVTSNTRHAKASLHP